MRSRVFSQIDMADVLFTIEDKNVVDKGIVMNHIITTCVPAEEARSAKLLLANGKKHY